MPKEWILNSVMNRFQLNFRRNVGPTSESIRKCAPKTVNEWENYYFQNVKSKEQIIELGKKLYIKISEVVQAELDDITEQDCIDYIINLVINRTFDGYMTEIFKERTIQEETHQKFTEVFGGKVFYIYSAKINDKKDIVNKEIINEIK